MANKNKATSKKGGAGKAIAVGASVAAIGAGAYYFLGPKGKTHRKKAKVWMTKMEKEVEKKVKTIKKMSGPIYHQAVDALAENYSKEYKAHAAEIKAFANKLKSEWKGAEKKAKAKARPVVRKVKKAVKKVKKAVK